MPMQSDFLEKTKIFSIEKNPESFVINEDSVKKFFISILEREEKLKNLTPHIDDHIWKWFSITVPGIVENFETAIFRFKKDLTHSQILEEAEDIGVKKIYSYLEALSIIREAILFREVDEKGKGILVYFQIEGNETLYRFYVFYDLGQLRVGVRKVRFDYKWDAGYGACFDNK